MRNKHIYFAKFAEIVYNKSITTCNITGELKWEENLQKRTRIYTK